MKTKIELNLEEASYFLTVDWLEIGQDQIRVFYQKLFPDQLKDLEDKYGKDSDKFRKELSAKLLLEAIGQLQAFFFKTIQTTGLK